MTPRSDPEFSHAFDIQKLRMDQLWRKKQIGDQTYIRSLTFAGYLPKDATVELNLLKMEGA
jgi:hypothetical protein